MFAQDLASSSPGARKRRVLGGGKRASSASLVNKGRVEVHDAGTLTMDGTAMAGPGAVTVADGATLSCK